MAPVRLPGSPDQRCGLRWGLSASPRLPGLSVWREGLLDFVSAHPEPSSLLPPHSIPLGRPSAPAPSVQYRASNLDWQLVSYMILYIFQCHSPKSSHPLPLPQSPKDCSIHQCLFCCLVHLQALQFASPGPESGKVSLGKCLSHRRFLSRL